MIEHCLRANLDEDAPNFYDIHSNVAVGTFRLKVPNEAAVEKLAKGGLVLQTGADCPPTKSGLSACGYKHLRVSAKNVIFGKAYGRAAVAIQRQCLEEGANVTVAEVQATMDAIDYIYPYVPAYQDACRARVTDPCWIRNPSGRLRRFIPSDDREVLGDLQRKAMNFVPQSEVADQMNKALYLLKNDPDKERLNYKIVLQLHDAALFRVPVRSVAEFFPVLQRCMVDHPSLGFRSCTLDGLPYPDSPVYKFGIDVKICERWAVSISKERADELGIPYKFGA